MKESDLPEYDPIALTKLLDEVIAKEPKLGFMKDMLQDYGVIPVKKEPNGSR